MCADTPVPLTAAGTGSSGTGSVHMSGMDNDLIDDDFDWTRTISARDSYGDEGGGYDGAEQRRALERKYYITRKPFSEVGHPDNRAEYAAAAQEYFPWMDEETALRYLLANTRYPYIRAQQARHEVQQLWFDQLDKEPYLADVAHRFPGRSREELTRLLRRCGFTPAAGDLGVKLDEMAARMAADEARTREIRERIATENAGKRQQWEEDAAARESRRKQSRLKSARERRARLADEIERTDARIAELEAEAPA